MTRLERGMLGLYGGAWLSLLLVCALCLAMGRALPLLRADGYGAWLYLGGWALCGVPLALMPRADRAWRAVLIASSVLLLLNAALVVWRVGSSAWTLLLSLLALALLGAWLRPLLDAARIRRHRPVRAPRQRLRSTAPRHDLRIAWWAWSLAMVCSFWCAWKADDPALRGAAYVTWLIVLLVALPAVCAGAWTRRAAVAGLSVSGVACALVYQPSGLLALTLLSLIVAALGFVWQSPGLRRAWTAT